ncbi:JAB domain-containing protein [Sphingomicrobium sp. XHP0239]|uniref:JAB domain-containing protein n=1 Tax=Sphingomicrobium maritimum TaxID=3133972 RepID=UPI0031CC840E
MHDKRRIDERGAQTGVGRPERPSITQVTPYRRPIRTVLFVHFGRLSRQIGGMLERFDFLGCGADAEGPDGRALLARVLQMAGVPGADIEAARLWSRFGSVNDLLAASPKAIAEVAEGRNGERVVEALACMQALMTHAETEAALRTDLGRSPEGVVRLFSPRIAFSPIEVVVAALFDRGGRLIGVEEIARGGMRGATVEVRAVALAALSRSAASIVLAHNHPSGDPTPSGPDRRWTRKLNTLLADLDVRLSDHLILARGRWISMRREMPEIF